MYIWYWDKSSILIQIMIRLLVNSCSDTAMPHTTQAPHVISDIWPQSHESRHNYTIGLDYTRAMLTQNGLRPLNVYNFSVYNIWVKCRLFELLSIFIRAWKVSWTHTVNHRENIDLKPNATFGMKWMKESNNLHRISFHCIQRLLNELLRVQARVEVLPFAPDYTACTL